MSITMTKKQFARELSKIGTAHGIAIRIGSKHRLDTPEGMAEYLDELRKVLARAQDNGNETEALIIEGIICGIDAPPPEIEDLG